MSGARGRAGPTGPQTRRQELKSTPTSHGESKVLLPAPSPAFPLGFVFLFVVEEGSVEKPLKQCTHGFLRGIILLNAAVLGAQTDYNAREKTTNAWMDYHGNLHCISIIVRPRPRTLDLVDSMTG